MAEYQLAEIRFVVFGPEHQLHEIGVRTNGEIVVQQVLDNRLLASAGVRVRAEGAQPTPPFIHNACTPLPASVNQLDAARDDAGLFHFTKLEAARSILISGEFRLSPITRMNDPRESRDWHFDVYCDELNPEPNLALRISGELSGLLRGRAYLASFATDGRPWTERGLANIGDSPALLHPSMWAAYADSHEGVVLVFRRNALIRNLITAHATVPKFFGNVRYVSGDNHEGEPFKVDLPHWRLRGAAGYATDHLNTHWRQLFFSKYDGWIHEREQRFLVFWNDTAMTPAIPINEALVEICIGEAASEELAREVKSLAGQRNINVSRIRWKNGEPVRLPFVSAREETSR